MYNNIILDSIADGVFTVDNDWNITSFNKAAEKIIGISKEQAIGQKCFEVFRADICQRACLLKQTMDSNKAIVNKQINVLNTDGKKLPISITAGILKNAEGKVVGGVETFRDLSSIEILRKEIYEKYTFEDIISKNHQILKMIDILPDVASSDCSVLIEGPTGSGKELVARAIHNISSRKNKEFVAVNGGALPDNLLESELFGYVEGAFTGANKDKPGRIAIAEGGTLFLDEIGDISEAMQVKLLRFLQEKEYHPLGSNVPKKADVRIVSATNKPLEELVKKGAFRQDLFYRINVVAFTLPSLSERKEDIPLLIKHFLNRFNVKYSKQIEKISNNAEAALLNYNYPGNIRELENIIEHAFVLCRTNIINKKCLPEKVFSRNFKRIKTEQNLSPTAQIEADLITEILKKYKGNRKQTSQELQIDPSTLWRKMKKYNIVYEKPSNEMKKPFRTMSI
ncbi:MAG: sigma 54-interacting transcriptional regulator [Verrucomicrobiota bacterium]|nr:sigma 54-interacting transcriptional regulator [Verrucomicrobiota bacterium]